MAKQTVMLAMGSVVQKKLAYAIVVLNEAFGEKLFNFLLFNFRYLVLCHPAPLRLQETVAMHSIMLAMGSVGQKKLASAIRV